MAAHRSWGGRTLFAPAVVTTVCQRRTLTPCTAGEVLNRPHKPPLSRLVVGTCCAVQSRICFEQKGWHLAKLPPKQQSSRLDVAIDIGCCRAQNTLSGGQWVHNCLCDVHAL